MTTLNEKATPLIQRLKTANEWRRGAEIEMPNPKQLGEDIDDAIKLIEALRWRDVNVELPEMGVEILVKCEDRVTSRPIYWVSWLDRKGHFCGLKTMGNDYTNEPTHWRPIETI